MTGSFRVKRLILKGFAIARRFRFWLAAGVSVLIFFQIIAFSPKRLEEEWAPDEITADALKPIYKDSFVAPTIPADRVPDYTVEGFQNVSTQAGVKQWRIQAERAFFYQADGIVHAREVKSEFYDAEGKRTFVTSKEAKYFMTSKDLELFVDVKTTFPTGVETLSPYMLYRSLTKEVTVPVAYPVEGKNVPPDPLVKTKMNPNESFDFKSKGLHYSGVDDRVELLSDVVTHVRKTNPGREPEITTIVSDHAQLDKKKNVLRFSMLEVRPDELRFVHMTQPGMKCRSRRAEFRMNQTPNTGRSMFAFDDVKIEEKPQVSTDPATRLKQRNRSENPRYATSGIAEFDSAKNLIYLRDYPQVYQDHDTITGETIIVHRDSDLVEVDQSNAFSEGNEEDSEEN